MQLRTSAKTLGVFQKDFLYLSVRLLWHLAMMVSPFPSNVVFFSFSVMCRIDAQCCIFPSYSVLSLTSNLGVITWVIFKATGQYFTVGNVRPKYLNGLFDSLKSVMSDNFPSSTFSLDAKRGGCSWALTEQSPPEVQVGKQFSWCSLVIGQNVLLPQMGAWAHSYLGRGQKPAHPNWNALHADLAMGRMVGRTTPSPVRLNSQPFSGTGFCG